MKFNYIVRIINEGKTVYRTGLLSEAIHFIEKQEEPIAYEVVKIETGEIIYKEE